MYNSFHADSTKVDKFIEIVKKHTDFSELTPQMIAEYIEKIVVHEADKSSGERQQQVDIYLNFIGKFQVPTATPPAEYADRAVLWNAVEKIEKAKNAQLARELEIVLPMELTRAQSRKKIIFLMSAARKSMTPKSGSTNAILYPPPTGTSRPKRRNGGLHGLKSATAF